MGVVASCCAVPISSAGTGKLFKSGKIDGAKKQCDTEGKTRTELRLG